MLAKDVIKRVREIQIRTGRQVADVLAGQYSSVFKGRGIEFDEVRPYVPGDEVRSIDWNVTARTGEPYVKRYVEERQLNVMVMADVSASQDFGSAERSKREAAAELCALIAFSATFNDDKVGLTLFHGEIEQYIPARKGQKHALRVVREILSHGTRIESTTSDAAKAQASGSNSQRKKTRWLPFGRRRAWWKTGRQSTNISGAVEFLLSVAKRRSVCFVVSDFFDDAYLKSLEMAARKHDVIAVLLTDPKELKLPNVGLVTLTDPETGESKLHDTGTAAFREQFKQNATDRVDELARTFRRAKIDFIHIDVSKSVVDPLAQFFRMREGRRRS
ncbi:MAG: DUF58 domain-containing protein [Pirellulaceae bacterium]